MHATTFYSNLYEEDEDITSTNIPNDDDDDDDGKCINKIRQYLHNSCKALVQLSKHAMHIFESYS